MDGEDDPFHAADFLCVVVGGDGVDVDARAAGWPHFGEVLFVAAEPGHDDVALFSRDDNGLAPGSVPFVQVDFDPFHRFCIAVELVEIDAFNVAFVISVIHGVRIFAEFKFYFLHEEAGVGKQCVVAAVVVMQVGQNDDVDVFGLQSVIFEAFGNSFCFEAGFLFKAGRIEYFIFIQTGVDQDVFPVALNEQGVDGQPNGFAVPFAVSHVALVELADTGQERCDRVVHSSVSSKLFHKIARNAEFAVKDKLRKGGAFSRGDFHFPEIIIKHLRIAGITDGDGGSRLAVIWN